MLLPAQVYDNGRYHLRHEGDLSMYVNSTGAYVAEHGDTEAEARAMLWLTLNQLDLLPESAYHREAA